MTEIKHIIWDWNGSLFDDRDHCVHCINLLLNKRKLPVLTLERYLEIFTFPVQEYYKKIGFDFTKEKWDDTAHEFMEAYFGTLPDIRIFGGATAILEKISVSKTEQYIISAMENSLLNTLVAKHNILPFFNGVFGIKDHYAQSKKDIAEYVFKSKNLQPESTLWIGDSLHDYEIARDIGAQILLLASGHQSKTRLIKSNAPVMDGLKEVEGYLAKKGII